MNELIPWRNLSLRFRVWLGSGYFPCQTEAEVLVALHKFRAGDPNHDVLPSAPGVNFTILPNDIDWTDLPEPEEPKNRFQVIDDFSKGV
jgi:hypothetical protein